MKISYNWLKQYLDITTAPAETGDLLTQTGLEVEGIETVQSIKGGLEGLVVGEVLSTTKHPNADKLKVTEVNIGADENLPIVCGAPNVIEGQKVIVATVGTTIYPLEGDSFQIKKAKIRGEASVGMICAEDEIGLGAGHDGIIVLPKDAPVGQSASEYYKIENDAVFEIGLTPNRADATSHIGVARDLVAVYRTQHSKDVSLQHPSVAAFKIDNNNLPIKVTVEDTEACPRYVGVTISDVEVKASPSWLKNRLAAIGLRPINNIVDVTNYVLHEMGQPLHAFDAAAIEGNEVIVKKLSEGTTFTTLDEVERKLSSEDLMICNAKGGMCIGGVFGGMHSGVTESTTAIFLESAYFHPVSIRKTAKRHALNTDASFRFERGVDPNNTLTALKRAALLIQEVAGGTISSEVTDTRPEPVADFEVAFSYHNCDRLIGKSIPRDTIKQILEALEIKVASETADGLELLVPPFKVDVQREADVIEEVLRIYGYNNIELPSRMTMGLTHRQKPDADKLQNIVSEILSGRGFREIMANSLTSSGNYVGAKANELVRILNPLSQELDVMRQSMIYSGLEAIAYNVNRQNRDLKFYEFGSTYEIAEDGAYKETPSVSLFMTGRREAESWNTGDAALDFYDLKASVEAILKRFGLTADRWQTAETFVAQLSTGLQYAIGEKPLVDFGTVSKETLQKSDIEQPVYYAVFDWAHIMKRSAKHKLTFEAPSRFPIVRRDLALLVDQEVSFAAIEKLARQTERGLLKQINLFDVYQGKNLERGKKSYAVSFTFQDKNKTLTDKQVEKAMGKLLQSFEKGLDAKLR